MNKSFDLNKFKKSFDWYQPFNIYPLDNIFGRFGYLDREILYPALLPRSLHDKSFLEIGCNTGKYCIEAKLRGSKRVVGIDPNEEWFSRAKKISSVLKVKEIEYLKMKGEELEKLGKFDYVAMFSVIHLKYISDPLLLLKKAYTATNEIFITEIFTAFFWRQMYKFGFNIFLKHPYPTTEGMRSILKNEVGFKKVYFAGKNKNDRDLFICFKK